MLGVVYLKRQISSRDLQCIIWVVIHPKTCIAVDYNLILDIIWTMFRWACYIASERGP